MSYKQTNPTNNNNNLSRAVSNTKTNRIKKRVLVPNTTKKTKQSNMYIHVDNTTRKTYYR